MPDTLLNVLAGVLVVAAVAALGCVLVTVQHRSMTRLTRSANRDSGGLPQHPYLKMEPDAEHRKNADGDMKMVLPGADMGRADAEDPKRA